MARLIRRHSMERLELYDLDKLITMPSINYEIPPPLPPPRIPHRSPSIKPSLESYQFLCNMTRNKTDPIYAATPMFTTIPQASQEKPHRQLLGSYARLENVKPLPLITVKSPEPKKVEIVKDKENENDVNEKEGNDDDDEEKEDDDDDEKESSSSSTDEEENPGGDDILIDDDKNNKGVVEQILNRDKKD